jgi:plastocyanin
VLVKFGSLRLRAAVVAAALALTTLVALGAPATAEAPHQTSGSSLSIIGGRNDPNDPNIAVLEFMPEKVTVKTGTTVNWKIAGPEPHSVTFVPPGTKVPPSTETDPTLFGPTPPTGPYDGTTLVNSGVLPQGETQQVQQFSMSFGKTGTYTYYCVLHPNMVGTITVTDGKQDTQKAVSKKAKSEQAKYFKEGEAAKAKLTSAKPKSTKNADGSTTWNVEMGTSTAHTDVLAFSPTPRKVKAGDKVTFVNNSAAPHTASFGGQLVPTVPVAPNVMNPVPGPSPQTLAQGVYLNTGWLPPKTEQGPSEAERSYTYDVPAPGTYEYVCVLHLPSGMAAEIDAS